MQYVFYTTIALHWLARNFHRADTKQIKMGILVKKISIITPPPPTEKKQFLKHYKDSQVIIQMKVMVLRKQIAKKEEFYIRHRETFCSKKK